MKSYLVQTEIDSHFMGISTKILYDVLILTGAQTRQDCSDRLIEYDDIIDHSPKVKIGLLLWDDWRMGDEVFIHLNATSTNDRMPHSKHYPKSFYQAVIRDYASFSGMGCATSLLSLCGIDRIRCWGGHSPRIARRRCLRGWQPSRHRLNCGVQS